MDPKEQQKLYAKMIARTWSDPEFKKRLIANPAAALKEAGIATPGGATIQVVENTAKVFHLVLPQKPAQHELTDAELDGVAGGVTNNMWGHCMC